MKKHQLSNPLHLIQKNKGRFNGVWKMLLIIFFALVIAVIWKTTNNSSTVSDKSIILS